MRPGVTAERSNVPRTVHATAERTWRTDLINRDKRAKGVIHHHRSDAARVQTQGYAAEVFAGERPPVAAMDENKYRRAAVASRRSRKYVQRLCQGGTEGDIQMLGQAAAGLRADCSVMATWRSGISQTQRGVVLPVDLGFGGEAAVRMAVGCVACIRCSGCGGFIAAPGCHSACLWAFSSSRMRG
jgi:hypothetical protein